MTEISSATHLIDAVLEGGPADFPAELRAHRVAPTEEKIKVCSYRGYEHFERVGAAGDDTSPVVFRWTGRTRVAE
ncbi:DUF5988 family protein [Micromonospora sp. NPDC051196]|uniref:DUF5988 family protein n=1 Tax=Micromonospora sp. NPDC051196 TaxID=3155281 RepID=UPI0034349C07